MGGHKNSIFLSSVFPWHFHGTEAEHKKTLPRQGFSILA